MLHSAPPEFPLLIGASMQIISPFVLIPEIIPLCVTIAGVANGYPEKIISSPTSVLYVDGAIGKGLIGTVGFFVRRRTAKSYCKGVMSFWFGIEITTASRISPRFVLILISWNIFRLIFPLEFAELATTWKHVAIVSGAIKNPVPLEFPEALVISTAASLVWFKMGFISCGITVATLASFEGEVQPSKKIRTKSREVWRALFMS